MFGHEKSNYTGYMLARHMKPKKILFHTRLVPHETDVMNRPKNGRRFASFAAKAIAIFGKL
jgi:hypothetical protein